MHAKQQSDFVSDSDNIDDAGHAQQDKALKTVATACEILCALILLGAAFLKLLSNAWDQPILYRQDPIIPLTNRTVLAGVAVCELLIAFRLFVSKSAFEKCVLLVWIALCFSIYRLGLWLGGVSEPCSCLGDNLGWWPWLAENRAAVSTAVFWIFLTLAALRLLLGPRLSASILAEHKPTTP